MAKLLSPKDIGREIGRERDSVARYQRMRDFPKPKYTSGRIRFYDAAEVRAWWAKYRGDDRKARLLAAWRGKNRPTKVAIAVELEVSPTTIARWLEALDLDND